MSIYDKALSVYDNLDCLENDSSVDEIDPNDLNEAKGEVSKIDDELGVMLEDLEDINGLHTDKELTVDRMNEFFEEDFPKIIENLAKIRGRLY